jgi:poly-gamma-glutamate synthesis protein (capsule biosynthesis protein)
LSELGSESGHFTMVVTGDSCLTRRVSIYSEPAFLQVVDLVRSADLAFTNLEMLFHDYEGAPMHETHGGHFRAEPALARELAWFGFHMISLANNHCGDYGSEGLRATLRHVTAAGLIAAGAGESLEEAREAKFFDTPRGRVALVATASTFPTHARASRGGGGIRARPGLNPLRHSTRLVVTREHLEMLRQMLRELGMVPPLEGEALQLLPNCWIEAGENPGPRTELDGRDLEEISAVVAAAARSADYTLVSLHAHEGDGSRFSPAAHIRKFAHAIVEAGADIVAAHGPHVLRGIEIYQGKPIFYSLGELIYQSDSIVRFPAETFELYGLDGDAQVADLQDVRSELVPILKRPELWESAVAVLRWKGKELAGIDLYPISLGHGQPRSLRGRPFLAPPGLAEKIVGDLRRLSEPFGTSIVVQDGIGIVRLSQRP